MGDTGRVVVLLGSSFGLHQVVTPIQLPPPVLHLSHLSLLSRLEGVFIVTPKNITMSEGFSVLKATEADIQKLIMAQVHIGSKNCNKQMKKYVHSRRSDGINIIDINKTYEKIVFAARIIASVENPADIRAVSGRAYGQRGILKFCSHVGCAFPIAGRFTPGAFTNQIQKAFQEPRLLVLTDPLVDHRPFAKRHT